MYMYLFGDCGYHNKLEKKGITKTQEQNDSNLVSVIDLICRL